MLDAHTGSLERTGDYLLAADGAPVDPRTRHLQEAHEDALARRLQQEQDAFSTPPGTTTLLLQLAQF